MHKLPALDYAYDALEPHFDAKTMEIHHSKHHKAYTDKFNKAIEGTELANLDVNEVLRDTTKIPENIRSAVINNGGGYVNHALFWKVIGPNGSSSPSGALAEAITQTFGSFDSFKEKFSNAASTLFGSGWAWLVNDNGQLKIIKTSNQDTPISQGMIPLMLIDVWEHAYYLKYQNKRPDYINAFWNVVNWDEVQRRFEAAQ